MTEYVKYDMKQRLFVSLLDVSLWSAVLADRASRPALAGVSWSRNASVFFDGCLIGGPNSLALAGLRMVALESLTEAVLEGRGRT